MKPLFMVLLCTISINSFAQKESSPYIKFGKITVDELVKKTYPIDTSANAVVLSDIGSSTVDGNNSGWFSLINTRHTVIHILKKTGYDEANIQIPLYVDGSREEKVSGLKGITYNLENNKIVETKLDKSNQFTEVKDKNHKVIKFTMPQVREGSIIEFQYEVTSEFISVLDPWYFQSLSVPTLWSEFDFTVPEFFSYNFFNQGYQQLAYSDRVNNQRNFVVGGAGTERVSFTAGVTTYHWVIKNSPQLKEENFTLSLRNHISRMEFQLASQKEPLTPRSYRSTWPEITSGLLESENFGEKLNANNGWMAADVKPLFQGSDNNVEKAKKIYEYVRDNFKFNDQYGVYTSQSLKNVFKTKQGSAAEINLLLTAMLRYADLDANPVLLSTTSHGYAFEYSPMINSMNYVVVQFNDKGDSYYLDATQPRLGFNRLPLYCYNGHARLVNKTADPLYFVADTVMETKTTFIHFSNLNNGKWEGAISQKPGYYESYHIRNKIAENGKEEFFKEIQKNYGTSATIANQEIDALKDLNDPLTVTYGLKMNIGDEDLLYINPTFGEGYKKNPFASMERSYPVEMPYKQEEIIIVTIEVPNGYKLDELPKPIIVHLDESGKSFFEYRISEASGIVSLINRIHLDRAFFNPDEYDQLRSFFELVVKKQAEQIVFKKIK